MTYTKRKICININERTFFKGRACSGRNVIYFTLYVIGCTEGLLYLFGGVYMPHDQGLGRVDIVAVDVPVINGHICSLPFLQNDNLPVALHNAVLAFGGEASNESHKNYRIP